MSNKQRNRTHARKERQKAALASFERKFGEAFAPTPLRYGRVRVTLDMLKEPHKRRLVEGHKRNWADR